MKAGLNRVAMAALSASLLGLLAARPAAAHCDTLDGPVVKAARVALEKGDVNPALKWVTKNEEDKIRRAFDKALAMRGRTAGRAA